MKKHQGRFPHLLKKYNKVVAFLGATIVLSTFAVKEGWRENLKTLGETIETARNIYTLRSDNQVLTNQLNGLGSEIEAIRGRISGTEFGFTALGVNRTMLMYTWQLQQLDLSLNNLSALLEKLPNVQNRKTELDDIAKNLQQQHQLHRSIGEMTARAAPKLTPEGYYPADEANAISAEIFRLNASLLDIYRRVNDATKETLADAEAIRGKQEKLYGIATWVSYGLYALGWMFALFGRLYGISGMGAED
jgi:predicted  nucleic acid-binding Zn-ribbon protein